MASEQTTVNTSVPKEEMTFSRLASWLAGDYVSIYYVNMKNSHYTEYAASGDGDTLQVLSGGENFFADSLLNCHRLIHPDDREMVLSKINKESFESIIRNERVFTLNYRMIRGTDALYYQLKATFTGEADDAHVIIGVRNVDEEIRHEQALVSEGEIYSQIAHAMLSRYEALYYVDIITDEYLEYSSSSKYTMLNLGAHSKNFFLDTLENIKSVVHPEDVPMLEAEMQKGKILFELSKDPTYSINYRLMINGKPEYVNLRVVRPKNDGRHIIIGITNINAAVIREREFKEALMLATRDPLTGVKNKRAYLDMEQEMDREIEGEKGVNFAVCVCDINNLKQINDEEGHIAGDDYIKDSCMMICSVFKHSPVYRIGGDEFVAILRGEDYANYVSLFEQLRQEVLTNLENGGIVIASGLAIYDPQIDLSVSDVFKRADRIMYKNKQSLKQHIM